MIPTPQGNAAVLLGEADKRKIVPIHVGGTEALSIALRMEAGGRGRPRRDTSLTSGRATRRHDAC